MISCCRPLHNLSSSTNTKMKLSTTFLIRLLWNCLLSWSTWPRLSSSSELTLRFSILIKLNIELTTGKPSFLCSQMIIENTDFPTCRPRWSKKETWKWFCPRRFMTTFFAFSRHTWKEWKLILLILLLWRKVLTEDLKSWMCKFFNFWRYACLPSSLSKTAPKDYFSKT